MTKKKAAASTGNHRTRVGRERRQQTEARILRAAVNVFANKSFQDVNVNDFLVEANVSRGTFYNHYRTNEELLAAVIEFLHEDLTKIIEAVIAPFTDPVVRLSLAIRIFYRKAMSDPVWADLVSARVIAAAGTSTGLRRDLLEGRKLGAFRFNDPSLGVELVIGTMLRHTHARCQQGWRMRNQNELVRLVLRGLGAAEARIDAALAVPVPTLTRKPHTFRKNR